MIPFYPQSVEIHLGLRELLHPMLQKLPDGISEFTFANLYLFQKIHQYRVSRFALNSYILEKNSLANKEASSKSSYLSKKVLLEDNAETENKRTWPDLATPNNENETVHFHDKE
ncbi:MAG: hypothetical protein HQK65_07605, partial [Desulfamplus sp.]|nr:hypothetical protein [Desulfamplus sp.]